MNKLWDVVLRNSVMPCMASQLLHFYFNAENYTSVNRICLYIRLILFVIRSSETFDVKVNNPSNVGFVTCHEISHD